MMRNIYTILPSYLTIRLSTIDKKRHGDMQTTLLFELFNNSHAFLKYSFKGVNETGNVSHKVQLILGVEMIKQCENKCFKMKSSSCCMTLFLQPLVFSWKGEKLNG